MNICANLETLCGDDLGCLMKMIPVETILWDSESSRWVKVAGHFHDGQSLCVLGYEVDREGNPKGSGDGLIVEIRHLSQRLNGPASRNLGTLVEHNYRTNPGNHIRGTCIANGCLKERAKGDHCEEHAND